MYVCLTFCCMLDFLMDCSAHDPDVTESTDADDGRLMIDESGNRLSRD